MEEIFCDYYITKKRRKRILYELKNPKKRFNAINRFCHDWSDYINKSNIIYQGDSLDVTDFERYLKDDMGKKGYIISLSMEYDKKNYSFSEYKKILYEEPMCIIVLTDNYCIIFTEKDFFGRYYLILKKDTAVIRKY